MSSDYPWRVPHFLYNLAIGVCTLSQSPNNVGFNFSFAQLAIISRRCSRRLYWVGSSSHSVASAPYSNPLGGGYL